MSIKKAEAHLEAMVANIGRLEAVMAKVTAADLETMRVNPDHRLPDELRSQMMYLQLRKQWLKRPLHHSP